jgi:MoaA/NifB/PqqE/SkfB family radical SAM enzyme
MELIHKVLRELGDLGYKGRITPYIFNEPLRDKRLLEFAGLAKVLVPKAHFMISTNGDYLKGPEDLEALFAAGVRQILINIYSASDGSKDPNICFNGIEKARARHEKIQGWLDSLDIDQAGSLYKRPPNKAKPRAHIEAKYGITPGMSRLGGSKFELQNWAGNIPNFLPVISAPLEQMCVRPWRVLNVNYLGNVVLCCMDYNGITSIGNVATSTVEELWNHPTLMRYRLFLQNKQRDVPLCDKCSYKGGSWKFMVKPVTMGEKEDQRLLKLGRKVFDASS